MLSFDNVTHQKDHLIFRDDAKPGLFWILPLNISAEKNDEFTGQLTMFGRGDPDRARNILGAFWSIALTPVTSTEKQKALKTALSTEEHPAEIRLADVKEATIQLTLNDDPLIAQSSKQNAWGGNAWNFSGQIDPQDAGDIREAWEDGLKDARADIELKVVGAEAPNTAHAEDIKMSLGFGNGHVTFATQKQTANASETIAGQRVLRFTIPISPGRRAAKKKMILSGFDT